MIGSPRWIKQPLSSNLIWISSIVFQNPCQIRTLKTNLVKAVSKGITIRRLIIFSIYPKLQIFTNQTRRFSNIKNLWIMTFTGNINSINLFSSKMFSDTVPFIMWNYVRQKIFKNFIIFTNSKKDLGFLTFQLNKKAKFEILFVLNLQFRDLIKQFWLTTAKKQNGQMVNFIYGSNFLLWFSHSGSSLANCLQTIMSRGLE